ncbi:hypothetical protein D3C73_1248060 [compost metagenome]
MCASIILAAIVIHMQVKYFATLVNRLKIQSQTVDLLIFCQWHPHIRFPVDQFCMHVHFRQWKVG